MRLTFLGGATTVTGSLFLLETGRARVVVDCGMFQGSPNEAVRNRVPFGFDPAVVDAILLTHAHLDHCGRLPVVVREGYRGPILATPPTIALAQLVLLDSGRLQEEFAKRERRWERRNPDRAVEDDREEQATYDAAVSLAEAGAVRSAAEAEHVPTTIEPDAGRPPAAADERHADPEAVLRAQPPELEVDLDAPLYTERDAERAIGHFRPLGYEAEREIAPGVHATFFDAGHILGSAIIRLRVEADADAGRPERTIVFSGDLGRRNTPVIRDPTVLTAADYVVVESTYGGREHEPGDDSIRILADTVRDVGERSGVLLVPSFAIGRTQEIVWHLDRLLERGDIPELPLFLDSPMASRASDIYRRFPGYYDEETARLLQKGQSPLDYPRQVVTNHVRQSKAIARSPRPHMIVASNGMLTGGRIVAHLRDLIDDPAATLLFVGYQGEGTLGSHLQRGARTVRIDRARREVRLAVRSIGGFSAHADESELLDWVGAFRDGPENASDRPGPRRVFLVHGDPEAQLAIEPKVRGLGFATHVPHWHEAVELD